MLIWSYHTPSICRTCSSFQQEISSPPRTFQNVQMSYFVHFEQLKQIVQSCNAILEEIYVEFKGRSVEACGKTFVMCMC